MGHQAKEVALRAVLPMMFTRRIEQTAREEKKKNKSINIDDENNLD